MSKESRRALVERTIEKWGKLGGGFEDDPGFRASVEEWIAGEIDIGELQERYKILIRMRREARRLR
jgi:hypothetical protein